MQKQFLKILIPLFFIIVCLRIVDLKEIEKNSLERNAGIDSIIKSEHELCLQDDTIDEFTVNFDTDGGTPVPNKQIIKNRGFIKKPEPPTKTGYTFKYWQYLLPCTDLYVTWDFEKDIVKHDVYLKAVYKKQST